MTVGLQRIQLKPGQFVFGRIKASKDLKINESSIRRIVTLLVNSGNITVKTTNKFSVITVMNWSIYQGEKIEVDHQATIKRPSSDHKQECKALKNNYSADFLEFYSAYPLKKSKAKAYKAWKKLKPDLHACLAALQSQMIEKGFLKAEKKFCPEWKHPSTWLNDKCWEDECETKPKMRIVYD